MSKDAESVQDEKKRGLERLLSSMQFLIEKVTPSDFDSLLDQQVKDRRQDGRLGCEYEIQYLDETSTAGSAQLLDVSMRGLRLRTEKALRKHATLALKPPEDLGTETDYPPVMARVVWACPDGNGSFVAGLLLPPGLEEEQTWLRELLRLLGYSSNSQRRQHVRVQADLPGLLQCEDKQREVQVLNLGMGGALFTCEKEFKPNTPFTLSVGPHDDLPRLELKGSILKATPDSKKGLSIHSARFGPLEKRRHTILREYIVKLLEE